MIGGHPLGFLGVKIGFQTTNYHP